MNGQSSHQPDKAVRPARPVESVAAGSLPQGGRTGSEPTAGAVPPNSAALHQTPCPVRILHLEDEPDFCKLVADLLAREGFNSEITTVGDLEQFSASLTSGSFDVILADYSLPNGTGLEALGQASRVCPETPFILVSGAVAEGVALDALKSGAADYVLKDRLERLPPVVHRAIAQASKMANLAWAESNRRKQSEATLRLQAAALEAAANAIVITDRSGRITWANAAFSRLTGYAVSEVIGLSPSLLRSGQHPPAFYQNLWQTILAGEVWQSEMINRRKNGELYTEEATITPVRDETGEIAHFIAVKQDVSARKKAELELKQTHNQLLSLSRQAAIAEFATGILHNVGNVLNSVGVASACLAESLKKSKSAKLAQVATLLREHETNLADFFANDPKAKLVPKYLFQLSEALTTEHATALQEIAQLQANVEHIKALITLQQDSARQSSTTEIVQPATLAEEAIQLHANACRRHHIQVHKTFSEMPPVVLHKHKVFQILVNLVRNAVQACALSEGESKQIAIHVYERDERLFFQISDTGIGIEPAHLSQVFTFGFTTKKDGHGFGLHMAFNHAKEMGGCLCAHSAGLGQGATFILELPLKRPN